MSFWPISINSGQISYYFVAVAVQFALTAPEAISVKVKVFPLSVPVMPYCIRESTAICKGLWGKNKTI